MKFSNFYLPYPKDLLRKLNQHLKSKEQSSDSGLLAPLENNGYKQIAYSLENQGNCINDCFSSVQISKSRWNTFHKMETVADIRRSLTETSALTDNFICHLDIPADLESNPSL